MSNAKYKKEDLIKYIIIQNLSYRKIGEIYGVSDAYIKKVALKFGISLPKRKLVRENFVPHNKGKGKVLKCQECQEIVVALSQTQKFCSKECEAKHKVYNIYQYYLSHQDEYCYDRDMKFIKKHLLLEQNNCCLVCGMKDEWNSKKYKL